MKQAVTLKPWKAIYPAGVALLPTDTVEAVKTDPEFPGWVWCRGPAGGEAWTPGSYIAWIPTGDAVAQGLPAARGRMKRSYDSTELTVGAGETLLVLEEESGWGWSERSDGRRGWIPISCLGVRSYYGEQ